MPHDDKELRRAVKAFTALLEGGEWAEHISRDEDATALECAITQALGKSAAHLSQPPGSSASPQDPPSHLSGRTLQAYRQCQAVAHMARSMAEVHEARAAILAHDGRLTEVIGESTSDFMETLGDCLESMDASTEEDEWMDPVFDRAHATWPQVASLTPAASADAVPDAALASPKAGGWRPIAEAPKEGDFLVFVPSEECLTVHHARRYPNGMTVINGDVDDPDCEMTHWMPLPEAPNV